MVALFDAFVDVREVGAEAGDGFEDSGTMKLGSISFLVGSRGCWLGLTGRARREP